MQRSEVRFEKGSILRKEMLEDIYAYPRVALESYYAKFSDGILYGLEWTDNIALKGHHYIMPGALKYHGNIYFVSKRIDVEEVLADRIEIDHKYRLCFVEMEEQKKNAAQTIYELELKAVQSEEYTQNKDKLYYYARVRCANKNSLELFEDGEIYGLFASSDGYGYQLPYWVTEKYIVGLVEQKENKHPLDYMILQGFYQGKGMALSFVKMYLREAGMSLHDIDFATPGVVVEKMKNAVEELQFISHKSCSDEEGQMNHKDANDEGHFLP